MYSELPTLRIAPHMAILGWGFVRVIITIKLPLLPIWSGLGWVGGGGGKWGKSQFSRELLWDNERQAVASLGTNWKHKLDKSGFLFQPKLKTKDHPQAMGFLFWFKIKPNVIFDILEPAAFRKYSTLWPA